MESGIVDKNSNRKQKKWGYGYSGTRDVQREIRDGEGKLKEEGGREVANREGKLRKRGVGRRTLVVIRVVTQRFGSVTTLTTAAYEGD